MIKNYLQVIRRYLAKNRLFAAINITGLSIAIASALYLLVYVMHESSYDTFHKNASRIYRVNYTFGEETTIGIFDFLIPWSVISAVALISTIFQIVSAANTNPARIFRNE
jgi:hypothetical protein